MQRAGIINLSLGGGGFSLSEQSEYTAARNQGVIIIAAAGNDTTGFASAIGVQSTQPQSQPGYRRMSTRQVAH